MKKPFKQYNQHKKRRWGLAARLEYPRVRGKRKNKCWQKRGFTLVELLVVLAVIGLLSSIILAVFTGVKEKARDTRRKAEISQFGKFLTMSCYLPDGGGGEYDFIPLAAELISKYPQYAKFFSSIPKDPKTGTDTESKYIYTVNAAGTKCALYANLENAQEPVTLSITTPTPGGGSGVLEADSPGWNGTPLYFQSSN